MFARIWHSVVGMQYATQKITNRYANVRKDFMETLVMIDLDVS